MDTLTWIAPDGTETPFDGLPGVRALGTQGLFAPPSSLLTDLVPQQAGARLRSVRTEARDFTIPVHVRGTSVADLRSTLRALVRTLSPQAGDGGLRATTPGGTSRELTQVRYVGGLELTQAVGQSGPTWQKAALVLRALDPYWYDDDSLSQTWALSGSLPVFFPILPVVLAPDTVVGTQVVDNTGDVDAEPVWTVVGPMTSVTLTNATTGETLVLTTTLSAGQHVIIDTRQGRKTVLRGDGTNLYGSLSASSALWSLPAGLNDVTVAQPGATVDSYVTLTYRRRWLTP